jgi:hypothetical protein
MAEIYILDCSAMESLNTLAIDDDTITDRLVELRDTGLLVYSETAKDQRRTYAKGHPITIWATSGWRSIQSRAVLNFTSVQAVMKLFPHDGNASSIMNMDDPENLDQQALATMSLAYQLRDAFEVIVVSDETFTAENRCTVMDACAVLQVKHLTVSDFLTAVESN